MDDRTDFSLEDVETKAEPQPLAASSMSPVIVVEAKPGNNLALRLIPPLLILLVAVLITSYQKRTRLRPLVAHLPRAEPATTDRNLSERSATSAGGEVAKASPTPAVPSERPEMSAPEFKGFSASTPTNEAASPGAEEASTQSPFDLEPAPGLTPFEPPSSVEGADKSHEPEVVASEPTPVPSPGPEPESKPIERAPIASAPVTASAPDEKVNPAGVPDVAEVPGVAGEGTRTDDVLRDIQREAEEKNAERQNSQVLKDKARSLLFNETLTKIQENRIPFRNAMRKILNERGDAAGEEIDQLCDQYGRETPPEIEAFFQRVRRFAPARQSRQAEIEVMRRIGLPEPVIFDYLCHQIHKSTMNTRGGPTTEDGVRVLAARLLLKFPVAPAGKPQGSRAPSVLRPAARPNLNHAGRP